MKVNSKKTYSEITGLPEPHPFTDFFKCTYSNLNEQIPTISIVVPVFNQENAIIDNLKKIIKSVVNSYEFIIVDDASTDKSLFLINDFFTKNKINGIVISTNIPVYETASDNVGFALSRCEYILEIQSDMIINDHGFDQRMINASSHPGVGTVSGRLGNSWNFLLSEKKRFLNKLFFYTNYFSYSFGRISEKLFIPKDIYSKSDYDQFILLDSNARGPWLIKKSFFNQFGLLDSNRFYQGNCDHEFNYRLSIYGYKACYIPVNMYSKYVDNTGLKKRKGLNLKIFNYYKKNKSLYSKIFLLKLIFTQSKKHSILKLLNRGRGNVSKSI